jgi:hypothetical protein
MKSCRKVDGGQTGNTAAAAAAAADILLEQFAAHTQACRRSSAARTALKAVQLLPVQQQSGWHSLLEMAHCCYLAVAKRKPGIAVLKREAKQVADQLLTIPARCTYVQLHLHACALLQTLAALLQQLAPIAASNCFIRWLCTVCCCLRQGMAACLLRMLTSPVNSSVVFLLSTPLVPSKTCTTALVPSTSSTCPRRIVPSPSRTSTISAYMGFCRARTTGPGSANSVIDASAVHSTVLLNLAQQLPYLHAICDHQRPTDTRNGPVLCNMPEMAYHQTDHQLQARQQGATG